MNMKNKVQNEWSNLRSKLSIEFGKAGIYYCEIRFSGCTKYPEGFAHTQTRQHMGKWGSEEREVNLREVVLACNSCHGKVEKKPFMTEFLRDIIRRREDTFSLETDA